MPRFCPNCGDEISEKVKFCPSCGSEIDSFLLKKDEKSIVEENKKDIKIEDTKIENKKIERKYTLSNIVAIGVIIVVIFIFLMIAVVGIQSNNRAFQSQYSTQSQALSTPNYFVSTPTESPTERNIRIANEVVADYHKSHTYSLSDMYVCGDMASDVWDMLKTKGINAKLNVGRVDYSISKIFDANHVWVLAEVAPDQYLALEATGGYSVSKKTNPLYYQGWSFYNPKQLKNYLQLEREYNDAISKYNSALNDYNNIVNQYNNAGLITRLTLKSQVDDKQLILQQRTQDLNQIIQQISALLSSL